MSEAPSSARRASRTSKVSRRRPRGSPLGRIAVRLCARLTAAIYHCRCPTSMRRHGNHQRRFHSPSSDRECWPSAYSGCRRTPRTRLHLSATLLWLLRLARTRVRVRAATACKGAFIFPCGFAHHVERFATRPPRLQLLEAADVGSIARRTKTEGIDDPLLSVPGIGAEKSKLFLGWTPQSLRVREVLGQVSPRQTEKVLLEEVFSLRWFWLLLGG